MTEMSPSTELVGGIRCNACPVLCRIRPDRKGACDRYGNVEGEIVRLDPVGAFRRSLAAPNDAVAFADGDGTPAQDPDAPAFLSGIGSSTCYPDYRPAPFIVSSRHDGVDMVTSVTEAIFSFCGVKVKIDTDKYIGPESAFVRYKGQHVGHVTTAEYGSQMLALGGVRHMTGGTKAEGKITCEMAIALCNKQAVELQVEGGSHLIIQAGKAPIIDGKRDELMRMGCGSAVVGQFDQWLGHVDEVIAIDDHITGLWSEHQGGKFLGVPPSGIQLRGRRSTPGRYFNVAEPGSGWGGTDVEDPLSVIRSIDPKMARPGLRLLITSTTGAEAAYYILDETLTPRPAPMPAQVAEVAQLVRNFCEPSLCTVLFVGGAGGGLRAGAVRDCIGLTRAVEAGTARITFAGAPAYRWPGGGIMAMVDVTHMPNNAFGYVPTPAIVAPLEFTMPKTLYEKLGGHMDRIQPLEDVLAKLDKRRWIEWSEQNTWPLEPVREKGY